MVDLMQLADLADECDVIVPVVGGPVTTYSKSIEAGAGQYAVPDLTHSQFEDLVPIQSNGVLQHLVKGIVKDQREMAAKKGFDPRRLPHDEKQAKRMGIPREYVLPAWMTDPKVVVSIEKHLREEAFEKLPDLRDLHHGEEEAGRLATQLFLETGWNPISSPQPMPRSVKENTELGRLYHRLTQAQDRLSAPSPRELASVGLLSDWLVNNGSEDTCTYTAPWISANGFDHVPDLGVNGEDLDTIQEIINSRLRGEPIDGILEDPDLQWRYTWTERHPKHLLDIANRIWHRMVELDGVRVGALREQMPRREVKGQYPDSRLKPMPVMEGQYQRLVSGLVVPA